MSDETNELHHPIGEQDGEEKVTPTGAANGVAAPAEPEAENAGQLPADSQATAESIGDASVAAAQPAQQREEINLIPDVDESMARITSHDAGQGIIGPAIDYSLTFRSLTEGAVIKGRVVHIDREGVLVDVGTKSEGLVPPQELSRGIPGATEPPLSVGDTIDVYVIEVEDQEGNPVLSKKRADFEKAWERVLEAKNAAEMLTAMVTDRVKGGLVVDLGIRGFIPASHVGNGRVRNLEQYIGQVLPLKVIEVDKERRKVVLSHRLATEEERERKREETVGSLEEGQVRPGIVRRITDYGAFVDLGGIDGLLHISEMSWSRIKHPSEVVKVGDDIQVMILKVNLEQNRVSLGLRQILPDPWIEASTRFNPGDLVKATVSRLVPFGAFVQLEGGIEGVIPNGELSSKRINKPEQVVKVGDELEAKVIEVEKEQRRIVLSKRQVDAQKEQEQFRDFNRDRQTTRERDTPRFTIGDALAGQLGDLTRADSGESSGEPQAEAPAEAPVESTPVDAAMPDASPAPQSEATSDVSES